MTEISVDYLIIGAGAVGMAFADTLLSETDATVAIVDMRHRPGGHWNDAYPFVRLHQPSAAYGVNSKSLGSGRIDTHPLNEGMFELASGVEIVCYFEQLMLERFLPSGRVRYLPLHRYADGAATSIVSGDVTTIRARKLVDATLNHTSVPSRRPPAYAVEPGMICIPPNALPEAVRPGASYVVIGAGKTGMDVCCWLLHLGVSPQSIRWVMPRDSWVLDRSHFQPGAQFLTAFAKSGADQVEALSQATSLQDLLDRLETMGEIRRIDSAVTPTAYHCATLSDGELRELRRISGIVRMGRVTAIRRDHIDLEHGRIDTVPDVIHIDCSASGLPPLPRRKVFDGNRINLLWVRQCQPVFSAAMIAHVEASFEDDAQKNALCVPIPSPQEPVDWLRMIALDLATRRRWSAEPRVAAWLEESRLNAFARLVREHGSGDAAITGHRQRYTANLEAAERNAEKLLKSIEDGEMKEPAV